VIFSRSLISRTRAIWAKSTNTLAPTNPADFLRLLEAHLQPLHVPLSRAALQAFVEACWPWMEDEPDVEMWAAKFLVTDDVMAPA
jgi:hypothetical protein